MGVVVIDVLGDGDVAPAVAYVAAAQQDAQRHIVYVGVDPSVVEADLAEAEAWRDRLLVARRGGDVVGVLLADLDQDMRRVWWCGPWADDDVVATALLAAGDAAWGGLFDQEEHAPDARNLATARLALARGCVRDTGSAVLHLADPATIPDVQVDGVAVLPLDADAHEQVAALHDLLFPGTHTTGAALVTAEDTVVHVARDRGAGVGGPVLGYVATQAQATGGVYVDYLGVTPSARGRGIGRLLVAAAVRGAVAADGVVAADLTVREDNAVARALYASLGFVEERVTVPYRRGFSLG